ncbi:hypothetical protein BDC45DRAFT_577570 [Circinella umbellata]|nr:hypothetical protein BDC45DRAFT_577570 [Circinella umbellata]
MPETDQQYLPFGFFSTIFLGSDVAARGMDHKNLDAVKWELLGIKQKRSVTVQSKYLWFLRDMLLSATYNSNLLHSAHVIGYIIQRREKTLLLTQRKGRRERELFKSWINTGFCFRSRPRAEIFHRTRYFRECNFNLEVIMRPFGCGHPCWIYYTSTKNQPIKLPTHDSNLVSRLLPLITFAYHGKRIIDETVDLLNDIAQPITMPTDGDHWCLPPNFILSSSPLQSSIESTSSSASKRRKTSQ